MYQRHDAKQDFFIFCSGLINLVLFHGFCSFVLRHLCPVHEVNVCFDRFHSIRELKQKITFPYLALNAALGASKTAKRTVLKTNLFMNGCARGLTNA